MQKHKGMSLVDVLVVLGVICVIVLLVMILLPSLNRPHRGPDRIMCATNLKGLGTAMMTYGLDYNDNFPVIGGKDAPWSKSLGWNFDEVNANYHPGGAQENSPRTITASWYLLVREVDEHPATFICKLSSNKRFENTTEYDLTELWDFGPDPYKHVSYAMQNPFGKFPATGASNPGNAIAADMNPWFQDGDIVPPANGSDVLQPITHTNLREDRLGNSLNHDGEGQNVLFGDGHVKFMRQPNCGVDGDNIYTYWSNEENPTDEDKQVGKNPTARDKENDSKSATDSFLAI